MPSGSSGRLSQAAVGARGRRGARVTNLRTGVQNAR